MLVLNDVTYCYHSDWFQFSLQVKQGDILALIGPSGAGKSTLLALIAGFCHPESGEVLVNGRSIQQLEPHQRPLSMLFQEHNLFDHLNVFDNIALGLSPALRLSQQDKRAVNQAAEKVGLEDKLTRLPGQLSGGQRQRVALARCFVQPHPIWLLDEPFSALDPILRKEMLAVVQQLAQEKQATVIMVTHHLSDARAIANRFAYLADGVIANHGEIAALTPEHANEKLARFVQAAH
ncbi:thiamine ABC transporter ATP-binding protein [Vibrio hangzhouensis]|uniref:Thiamine transport system ATP-binding protein n=1 Tax=Vibrio hangzhouensis TaxID=462991 RepID=A0A1H6BFS9_9VIBR|nr:thiamine ABC transporter ATP-binding protein [Vibrio hangzhouensis]SEG59589.1 thiamine transport system ATP-binding protein [Vibrio hangzhouensis]